MVYTVLRPVYQLTGERGFTPEGRAVQWERVSFVPVGYASSVKDARERYSPVRYGYALVLAETGESLQ